MYNKLYAYVKWIDVCASLRWITLPEATLDLSIETVNHS